MNSLPLGEVKALAMGKGACTFAARRAVTRAVAMSEATMAEMVVQCLDEGTIIKVHEC